MGENPRISQGKEPSHGVPWGCSLGWIQPPGCREPLRLPGCPGWGLSGSVLRVLEAQPLAWEWKAVKIMRLCQFTASQKLIKDASYKSDHLNTRCRGGGFIKDLQSCVALNIFLLICLWSFSRAWDVRRSPRKKATRFKKFQSLGMWLCSILSRWLFK